jgi:septum formation protein
MKMILASQSPRRRQLLQALGCQFEAVALNTDESFPSTLKPEEVAAYLAEKKSMDWGQVAEGQLLITCDTTVVMGDEVINKPANEAEAIAMLEKLSGRMHTVVSGVCIRSASRKSVFSTHTKVFFRTLELPEIQNYVYKFKPLDKAGAYGIQDWIGYVGVTKIEGCYYNVMGLPMSDLYAHLKEMGLDLNP